MNMLLIGLGLMLAGGLAALTMRRWPAAGALVGAGAVIIGSILALLAPLTVLVTGVAVHWSAAWSLPLGALAVEIDPLAAFFLSIIFGLSILTALYGRTYLQHAGGSPARQGSAWFWFNLLVVAMAAVVMAGNVILFLLAWEVMSVASFFLVAFESEREQARRAAWTYLVAAHLGSALLLAMFVVMGTRAGSFNFADWILLPGASAHWRGAMFVLALIGFGVKAGIYPLHVWLPEAHPAAPSHVSALMSGVMLKVGVYALIRLIALLGAPDAWWGWLMIAFGVISGILGVLFAMAQHDIKRLLAYHSVENIGIIFLGLGLGVLGWYYGQTLVMAAGLGGALLHVLNHAVFKGLLFLNAGAVAQVTGCRNIEELGGLMRRMPQTGACFLIGSAAISGLPPFNGFVSEFLIYTAALLALIRTPAALAFPALVVVGALALIGGLAAACFVKIFGIVFLGAPRSAAAEAAHECRRPMRAAMLVLALCCAGIAMLAPWIAPALFRAVAVIIGAPAIQADQVMPIQTVLVWVSAGAAAFWALSLIASVLRRVFWRGRKVARTVTWDCGYTAPSSRMQYTASSFVQPVIRLFGRILRVCVHAQPPEGFFPNQAKFEMHAGDTADRYIFRPLFQTVACLLARLRWLQEGRVQIYVLYIAVTLLVLLLFAL